MRNKREKLNAKRHRLKVGNWSLKKNKIKEKIN